LPPQHLCASGAAANITAVAFHSKMAFEERTGIAFKNCKLFKIYS